MATSPEALDAALDHFRAYATERGIPCIPGYSTDESTGIPVVQFRDQNLPADDPLAAAKAFTAVLAAIDVAMFAIHHTRFMEDYWRSSVALIQAELALRRELRDQSGGTALESVLAETKHARQHIGRTAVVGVTVITRNPTILIEWMETTDWYDSIITTEREILELDKVDHVDDVDEDIDEDIDDDEDWKGSEHPLLPPPPPRARTRRTR